VLKRAKKNYTKIREKFCKLYRQKKPRANNLLTFKGFLEKLAKSHPHKKQLRLLD
jgi:hypothetical protein